MANKSEQFIGRDGMGLIPDDKGKIKTEAEARVFYFKMIGKYVAFQMPLAATAIYYGIGFLSPRQAELYRGKLVLIREYDLGYIYLAWYLIFLARLYAVINSNGARAPARVDRPDQYAYQIMAESGPLANGPYVLMTTTGAIGRFNRYFAMRVCVGHKIVCDILGLALVQPLC